MDNNNEYKKGEWYEQGRYIGVIDEYPWGEDYFIRNHHFMEALPVGKDVAKINKIFIKKIKRTDR